MLQPGFIKAPAVNNFFNISVINSFFKEKNLI